MPWPSRFVDAGCWDKSLRQSAAQLLQSLCHASAPRTVVIGDNGGNGSRIVPTIREVRKEMSSAVLAAADRVQSVGLSKAYSSTVSPAQGLAGIGSPPPLQLSGRFSPEQREMAQRIWEPIVQQLAPLLTRVTRLECSDTPNGLIAESADGWTLAMCCLSDQRLPHAVSVRHHRGETRPGLQALLSGDVYKLRAHAEALADLQPLLQTVLRHLGGRRAGETVTNSHRRCPRQAVPVRTTVPLTTNTKASRCLEVVGR